MCLSARPERGVAPEARPACIFAETEHSAPRVGVIVTVGRPHLSQNSDDGAMGRRGPYSRLDAGRVALAHLALCTMSFLPRQEVARLLCCGWGGKARACGMYLGTSARGCTSILFFMSKFLSAYEYRVMNVAVAVLCAQPPCRPNAGGLSGRARLRLASAVVSAQGW